MGDFEFVHGKPDYKGVPEIGNWHGIRIRTADKNDLKQNDLDLIGEHGVPWTR